MPIQMIALAETEKDLGLDISQEQIREFQGVSDAERGGGAVLYG